MSQDGVAIRDIREKSKDREVKNTFIHSAVTPLVGSREQDYEGWYWTVGYRALPLRSRRSRGRSGVRSLCRRTIFSKRSLERVTSAKVAG